jgi:phenylacetate-coenzyme A ligase PaaK-like adenylate-forming protein
MGVLLKPRILFEILKARQRDRWTPARLAKYQQMRLVHLLRHARQHSPYYSRKLGGQPAPRLAELPVLTKAKLVEHWDEIVTDRRLRRDAVLDFIDSKPGVESLYNSRWHAMATSGTSGLRAPFVYDEREWAQTVAALARTSAWREFGPSPSRPLALVSLDSGVHMAARIAATLARVQPGSASQVDATAPVAVQVDQLNALQPTILAGYPSALAVLADAQAAGRLRIAPRMVIASSEVLTPAVRERLAEVFGVAPHDTYATTETAPVGGTCRMQSGLHLEEDMTLFEVVDDEYRPVAPGQFGSRLLATVLWSRTLPLIRYELSDRLRLAATPCGCGLPFRLAAEIDGRASDVLVLAAADGGDVRVAPSTVQGWLRPWPIQRWQIEMSPGMLRLRVVPRGAGFDAAACERGLSSELAALRVVATTVTVEAVAEIATAPSGKVALFVAGSSAKVPPVIAARAWQRRRNLDRSVPPGWQPPPC